MPDKINKIIEILDFEACRLDVSYGRGDGLHLGEEDFKRAAEKIVKLFAIPKNKVYCPECKSQKLKVKFYDCDDCNHTFEVN